MDDQASYECLVESGVVLEGQVVKCYDVAQKLRPSRSQQVASNVVIGVGYDGQRV